MTTSSSSSRLGLNLLLATLSFAICFAAWGLMSALAPHFRELLHLDATQTALLVAVPVLLGSLARLPMGILADRFGGRLIFTVLMLVAAVPTALVATAQSYHSLLLVAFFLGLAGSSFAVGVGFVSRRYPPERQGTAVGVYGVGNIGQSAVVFGGPLLAAVFGWQKVVVGLAALLVVWAVIFAVMARNPQDTARPKSVGEMLSVLRHERLSWALSAFYFLTFGGFVAFGIYLPSLLRSQFGLGLVDAGFRAAGFVVLATAARPLGGWLSDKIGGARLLSAVFLGIVPFALLLIWPAILPFTVGALGCATLLGLGNGAVFKLVPQYFPLETGTVTGLVGALGGLGGFFPPLLLGFFRDHTGSTWPAFGLLAATSLILWWVNAKVFIPKQQKLEDVLPAGLTSTADNIFTIQPIGYVKSPYKDAQEIPKGLGAKHETDGVLEILPEFELGLTDIEGFSHLMVIWVFHCSQGFELLATPPSDDRPHGVFATRSPKRPNHIGLTVVELSRRDGSRLYVRGVDMLDGTPILDIKPYLSSIPAESLRRGWLAEAEARKSG